MRRLGLLVTLAVVALAGAPAGAQAPLPAGPQVASQDSDAPPGAPPHWLPGKAWVMQHWLPYDEQRLYRLLRADRGDVWRWLRDDTRNLAGFAQARGWDPEALAAALVEPWNGRLRDPARLDLLRTRALKTLTQGHLSQHLFFHSLHQNAIPDNAPAIFGVASREQFQLLRRGEVSPVQICRLHGLSAAHAEQTAAATLRAMADKAVRMQAMPAVQARRLLARQLRQLPRWLDQTRYNGPPPLVNPRASEATAANFSNNAVLSGDGRRIAWEAYEANLATVKQRGEINVLARGLRSAGVTLVSSPSTPIEQGLRSSYNPSISADGRYVAFESAEGNLNFAKRYGKMAVFVRDTRRGTTRIVSPPATPGGSRSAYEPSISGDGRRVVFASYETSLDAPGAVELWLSDRRRPLDTGELRDPGQPRLSRDGNFVVFSATPPAGSVTQVYRQDLRTRRTVRVSAGAADAYEPEVSATGRFVAYTELVPGTRRSSVRVTDLRTGATRTAGAQLASASEPAISDDGATVAFSARDELGSATSVWVDEDGAVELVSRSDAGTPAAGSSSHPAISGSGRIVTFTSDAWNLSASKCNAARGVFARDRRAGTTRLLSTGDGANRFLGPTRGSSAPGDMTVALVCA